MERKLELRSQAVGPWPMNTYALICPHTGQSVLIDPGAEPDTLSRMLAGSEPIAILLTHSHPDHIGALNRMQALLNVPLMAHRGPHANDVTLDADRWLEDGDAVQVGEHVLRVYHTPGHIGDQICFYLEDDHRCIVGDTIFEGGPGKTWSPEGFRRTLQTLREVVLAWDDETICYPGHGPHFRLGDVRERVEGFLEREHGEFYGDATWEM